MEIWKAVVGAKGSYEVSSFGRVRSLTREITNSKGAVRTVVGVILKTRAHKFGYPMVTLSLDGVTTSRTVHSLIAEAFIGPRPKNCQVRHMDGDPSNCRLDNILYGTPKQNAGDKLRHGTKLSGEDIYCSYLKEADIVAIRTRRSLGEKLREIASDYNLSEVYVHHICIGKKWADAAGPITPKRRHVKILDSRDRDLVREMRADGFSLKKIAQHFGVSVTQIVNTVGKGK